MAPDTILILASLAAASFGVLAEPMSLAVRAVLRRLMGHAGVLRWQVAARVGLSAGLVGATALSGWLIGGSAAVLSAALVLLILLAILDLEWRWLPFEWTLPLLGLGLLAALVNQTLQQAVLGLMIGAGTLWLLQAVFQYWRGLRALGTGDIWLAAGLGALAGPYLISWILCLAAATALAVAALENVVFSGPKRGRLGVAYGAHLCLAYLVLLIL